MTVVRRCAVVLLVGLGVGAATAVLQGHLDQPWGSLVNAASPWVTPAFAVGVMWRRLRSAVLAGAAVCGLELVGYYGTDLARGFPATHIEVLFWGACALVGGPVFGAAGWAWWRGPQWSRGLGASALPTAYLAEAVVTYGWQLHYWSTAMLFVVVGLATIVPLSLWRARPHHVAGWLLAAFPVGVMAELALGVVTRTAF